MGEEPDKTNKKNPDKHSPKFYKIIQKFQWLLTEEEKSSICLIDLDQEQLETISIPYTAPKPVFVPHNCRSIW